MNTSPCYGQLAYERGFRQGAYFFASALDSGLRESLIDSRINQKYRKPTKAKNKIHDEDILVVLSQDCDITHSDDNADPLIELGVFRKVDLQRISYLNSYGRSVRNLNLVIEGKTYIANLHHIIWCSKQTLFDATDKAIDAGTVAVKKLPDKAIETCVTWRANRYLRLALPNNFNEKFHSVFEPLKAAFEEADQIKELYINLNTYEEATTYKFAILALLDASTSDEALSKFMGWMEALSENLVDKGLTEASDIKYCARVQDISVWELSQYRKMSLEYVSLKDDSELP